MKHVRILLLIITAIVLNLTVQAQNDSLINPMRVTKADSVKVSKHSPTTAMLLSIVPGGGQIYNHKAWKIPIFYAGLAGCGHFIYHYANLMVGSRNEYINRRDGNIELLNPKFEDTPTENLIQLKNDYMRNMEIAIGIAAIVYALNIVDAMVDAHLYYFDVSDDLSLQWAPSLVPTYASNRMAYGLTLQFRW